MHGTKNINASYCDIIFTIKLTENQRLSVLLREKFGR